MNFFKKEKADFLFISFENRRKTSIRENLTLPKTVLQVMLKGKHPPQELIEEALESIENVVDQLG